jgi:hypothetical protein
MALVDRYSGWNKAYKLGKYAPQPAQKPRSPAGRPMSPMEKLMAELAAGPRERSEQEWASELDPRVKPFTDAIDASTLNARARSEFQFENASRANKDMGSAFLGILTGGKTGAEAEAYSKSEFGGSYLGGQAMEMATQNLRGLTADWDEREWEISGEYLKAMQQVPGIREELRASIEKDDVDDYTRKFQYATLLLDETYRQSQLAEEKRQFGVTDAFEKQKYADQKKAAAQAAKQQYGIDLYGEQTDRINAQTSAINAATRQEQLALNRAKEQRQQASGAAAIRQADANIRLRKAELELAKKKAKGGGSNAQKGENDLALDVLRDEAILGRVEPGFEDEGRKGGKTREEARVYITGLAEAAMPYRSKSYIAKWVAARLKALYPPAPRRSGR